MCNNIAGVGNRAAFSAGDAEGGDASDIGGTRARLAAGEDLRQECPEDGDGVVKGTAEETIVLTDSRRINQDQFPRTLCFYQNRHAASSGAMRLRTNFLLVSYFGEAITVRSRWSKPFENDLG